MKLELFARMHGLQVGFSTFHGTSVIRDLQGDQSSESDTKRLQFDASKELYSEVERVCSLLSCSKRLFLEYAVTEAVDRAQLAFEDGFEDVVGVSLSDAFPVKTDVTTKE